MLEKFPIPSIPLLNKIRQGRLDLLKALKVLGGKGEISTDLILMVDEIYLQKAAQYQAGEYVGADNEGNLYKGIVAFMVVGLKQSMPYSESKLFFGYSANHGKRTYMFFDTVHLLKNIRNNLLNTKKFVFPEFSYNQGNIQLHCPQGYIG